ncbi:hypothetical protein Vi05172_g8576 [Venturia inaequalis]|nr:hypothetical protein Vi05172_g8576 [Venturia inaequalis]
MPIPTSPHPWTPSMLNTLLVLKAEGFDVEYITKYLIGVFGGPREVQVVLRKMQEIYFWEKMGVRMNEV